MAGFFTCGAGSHIGDRTIPVVAQANPTNEWREGSIIVNSGVGHAEVVRVRQEPGGNIIIIPESDYLIFRYIWSDLIDGRDFDSATTLRWTGNPLLDDRYVGWSRQMANSSISVQNVLFYGGDNQQSGAESCMINMRNLTANFPALQNQIQAFFYGNWFEQKISGNITIEFTAYKGGTMSLNSFVWSNIGGSMVFQTSKTANVQATGTNNWTDFHGLYTSVGKFVYDKSTATGRIELF